MSVMKQNNKMQDYIGNAKYIDPLSDWGFRRLFGSEPDKELLIDFLNSLFEGEKLIVDLVYSPAEHIGESQEMRKVFFDLQCTGINGEQFVIEMQRAVQKYFVDRSVFYLSRLIHEQFKRGETNWKNVGLKEVYLIAILEFIMSNHGTDRYLHNVALANTDTGEIFYRKLGYKFIELPNFVKTENELVTDRDKWIYLLKNLSRMDKIPAVLNKRIFQRFFKIAEIDKLTEEEKTMYNSSLKARIDYENSISFAEENGYYKGKEEGIELGKLEGKIEGKLETARNLIKLGIGISDIAKATGLSLNEIQEL